MKCIKKINQSDVDIGKEELEKISECIEQRWLSEGEKTKLFAQMLSNFSGSKYITFAPNGTLGLFVSLLALDLPKGSEILLPNFTFYASATACIFAGLKPVFVDVCEKTWNATVSSFERAISKNTRAIMAVHIFGQSCEIEEIVALARRHNLKVVEDAAQAVGVRYKNRHVGTFGDVGVFSFFSDKVITTGEGAAILTEDEKLYRKIQWLRNQGREHSGTFIHEELGMNFRITDLQAAIGLVQLEKFPKIWSQRLKLWNLYFEQLKNIQQIDFMQISSFSNLVPFRFYIRAYQKEQLEAHLQKHGISTRSFFYPMHMQPKLRQYRFEGGLTSEKLYRTGLCLPIHSHISEEDVEYICDKIREFFS